MPRSHAVRSAVGVHGVEVADEQVGVEAERERVVEAGVGRDDEAVAVETLGEVVRERITSREHERTVHGPSLRGYYPEQVRGVGGAAGTYPRCRRGRPLSPAVPSSPWDVSRAA